MKTRTLLALLTAAFLLFSIAGCGPAAQKKESVTIYLRSYAGHKGICSEDEPGADYDSLTRYLADQFVAQYDKYDVSVVTEYFALNDEPKFVAEKYGQPDATDIVYQDAFVNLGHAYEGRLVPLDDLLSEATRADSGADFADFYEIGGRVYYIPYSCLPTVFVYNAELFRQAGLDEYIAGKEEIADWSIDEWNAILATLKKKLPKTVHPMMMYGRNFDGDMVNMMLLRMFGNPFFDANGNACLNDKNGIKALRWIKDNYDKGFYPTGAEHIGLLDCFELFRNKQLAIYFGNNTLARIFDDPGVDLRYVLYPHGSGRGLSFDFTYTFAVFDNGDARRLEVAKDFLRFLYTDEKLLDLSAAYGDLPAFSSVARRHSEKIPLAKQWRAIRDTRLDFTNRSPNYPGVRAAFYPEISAMLSGDQTPEETARNLDEKINAAIEKGRVEGVLHDPSFNKVNF